MRDILKGVYAAIVVFLYASVSMGDTLVVKGTVTDSDGEPIPEARVIVSVGFGPQSQRDTVETDENGEYEVTLVPRGNQYFFGVQIVVRAEGYRSSMPMFIGIENPNDGNTDVITQDVVLVATSSNPPTIETEDTVIVRGVVRDTSNNPIEGARVSASLSGLGSNQSSVRTGSSGAYSIVIPNPQGFPTVTITASATGYEQRSITRTIQSPNDGKPDTIVYNFRLTPIAMRTITVVGNVESVQGDPIAGALAIISFQTGVIGELSLIDSAQTNDNGKFSASLNIPQNTVGGISWRIEANGYRTSQGTSAVPGSNDTLNLGTIELVAYTTSDSVRYTVTGRVTNSEGNGIRDAQVIVTIKRGNDTLLIDTVTTGSGGGGSDRGTYSVRTPRIPYQPGEITAVVSVNARSFKPETKSVTVASSTTTITVNFQLVGEDVAIISAKGAVAAKPITKITAVYSVNGKLLGSFPNSNIRQSVGSYSRQPLIVKNNNTISRNILMFK